MKGRKNGRKPKDFTGTISWSANTGCADSTVSGYPGVATCTTSTLAAGTDTVTATYGGDVNHNGGSGSVSQVVTASNGNVSVATSGSPSTYGNSVTFTATVTGDNGLLKRRNGVKPMDVTGTVSWSANTGCADSTVSGYPGTATCTTSSLGAGTDTVTANYSRRREPQRGLRFGEPGCEQGEPDDHVHDDGTIERGLQQHVRSGGIGKLELDGGLHGDGRL